MPNEAYFNEMSLSRREFICATAQNDFEDLMYRTLVNSNQSYVWIYVGSRDGVIRNVPGFKFPNSAPLECSNFDPRLRTWYTQTAFARKNIIYVIETSNAINRGGNSLLRSIKESMNASIMISDH